MSRWIPLTSDFITLPTFEILGQYGEGAKQTVLYLYFLFRANDHDNKSIKRGQFVESVSDTAEALGIQDSTARKWISRLESAGMIKRERYGSSYKTTVVEYDKYVQKLSRTKAEQPKDEGFCDAFVNDTD